MLSKKNHPLGEGNSICRIWGDDSLTYCLTVAGFKWSHRNSQLSTYPLFSRDSRPLIQRLSAMGVVQRSWDPVSQSRRSKGRNAQPLTPSLSPPAIRYNGMPTIPASAKCFNATDIMSITLTVSTEIPSRDSQPWSIREKLRKRRLADLRTGCQEAASHVTTNLLRELETGHCC